MRRNRPHQGESRRRRREHQSPDLQAPAQRDETVAEEQQGVARSHEEDQGQITQGGVKPVGGEGIQLADGAREAERGERQCQVATAPLPMAKPVHDREDAQRQEAEADGRLNDLERLAPPPTFSLASSEKATYGDARRSSAGGYHLF